MIGIPRTKEEAQWLLDELEKHPNLVECAKALGKPPSTLRDWRKRANQIIDYQVPEGQNLKGVSTLYKGGEKVLEWVKTDIKQEALIERLKEFCEGLKDDIPRQPIARPPPIVDDELLNFDVRS